MAGSDIAELVLVLPENHFGYSSELRPQGLRSRVNGLAGRGSCCLLTFRPEFADTYIGESRDGVSVSLELLGGPL
jgi:hypothetical protein